MTDTIFTERELFLLQKELEYPITRYLLANSFGRLDGYEKAKRHNEISVNIAQFLIIRNYPISKESSLIHDYTTELTDRLDEVIGFPIDWQIYGEEYDKYVYLFFEWIKERLSEMYGLINKDQ